MNKIEKILREELSGKAFEVAVIPTDKLSFSPEVLKSCLLNHCGRYNNSWMCPPAVGEMAELEKKYKKFKHALVFTTKTLLEDSFDIEGMDRAREEHIKIEREAVSKVKHLGTEWMSAGSCSVCEKCTYPGSPCRYPDITRPSAEACGIDVTVLAKTCNIRYYNGENTVTYFTVILYN